MEKFAIRLMKYALIAYATVMAILLAVLINNLITKLF